MLLIFDCDGVLVDSELLHAEVDTAVIASEMGVQVPYIEYNKRFVGTSMTYAVRTIAEEYGVAIPDDFVETNDLRKQEVFSKRLRPIPYIADALAEMPKALRCVASNTRTLNLNANMKFAGLHELFAPHIFSAEMVEHRKPAPDLYLYAAKQCNVPTEECLVIEDSPAGVQAAKAAHMPVFGFVGGSHCYDGYEKRLAEADLIFKDMRELPQLVRRHFTSRAA